MGIDNLPLLLQASHTRIDVIVITRHLLIERLLLVPQVIVCLGHGHQILLAHLTKVVLLPDVGGDRD